MKKAIVAAVIMTGIVIAGVVMLFNGHMTTGLAIIATSNLLIGMHNLCTVVIKEKR